MVEILHQACNLFVNETVERCVHERQHMFSEKPTRTIDLEAVTHYNLPKIIIYTRRSSTVEYQLNSNLTSNYRGQLIGQ